MDINREIQGVTAPFICIGASKFMALKLLGFVRMESCLNDFFHSRWAIENKREYPPELLCNAWGWDLTKYNALFNRKVLPVAINNHDAGVMTEGEAGDLEYHYFLRHPGDADQLLGQNVPLVVGVTATRFEGDQNHHIVVVRNADGNIWAIDPWPGPNGVVNLSDPGKFRTPFTSFLNKFTVKLSIGVVKIPCSSCLMGFYRPPGEGMADDYRYKLKLAL